MAFELTLAMRLRAAYLTLHRRANALFAPHGMTADQFVVISVLGEYPGLIQTQLSSLIATDANTVTAMLRVLERRGLIRREAHDGDGRARRVYLTARGKREHNNLVNISAAFHRDLEAVAEHVGRDNLYEALSQIAARATVTPCPRPDCPSAGNHKRRTR